MIFDKSAKTIHNGESAVSLQQMVLGKLDTHMQKNKVGPLPYNRMQKLTQNGLKT